MDNVKILEVKQSIFASNDEQAAQLRQSLKEKKIFLLNLMSAPGSGKTTTLRSTIAALKDELRIGVMEADIDSDVDAKAIAAAGAKAIQLHTGGMCHLDAEMTRQGLEGLGPQDVDLVVLENVGNLVCPAEFDTGAVKNAMILSVPEGDDKPLKYPLMFQVCDVVLINKIDVLPYFDFDMDKCREYIAMRNPNAKVIPICAKTGEGIADCKAMQTKQNMHRAIKGASHERTDRFPTGRKQAAVQDPQGHKAAEKNYEAGADDHRPCARQAAPPDGGGPRILGSGQHCD